MKKQTVLQHFGGARQIAEAIGINRSAIYQWPEIVPAESALKIEIATKGKLKVNPLVYATRDKT